MEIVIRTRDLDWSEEFQQKVERSIHYAVDRHSSRIDRITVTLSDLNGPRGGVDKLCQIAAEVRGAAPVLISETGEDLLAAVGRTARRLGYRIGRNIDRRRRSGAPARRASIRVAA